MAKKLQSNTEPELSTNKTTYTYDDYFCVISFKKKPVSDTYLEQLAHKIIAHAENKNIYKMEQIYVLEKHYKSDIVRWCKRSEILNNACKYAFMIIGTRREVQGLTNKLNANIVLQTMALYDEDYKSLIEWRESLKSQDINVKIPDIVEIPVFRKDDK